MSQNKKIKDKIRILFVDDYRENLTLFENVFSKEEGLDIQTVTSGQEAIDILEDYKPHVVLIDIQMPDMDGYEATKRISKIKPSLPIILLSAENPLRDDVLSGLRCGAADYFDKPTDF